MVPAIASWWPGSRSCPRTPLAAMAGGLGWENAVADTRSKVKSVPSNLVERLFDNFHSCSRRFLLFTVGVRLKFSLKITLNAWRRSRPGRMPCAFERCVAALILRPNCGATTGVILRRCSDLRGISPAAWILPALQSARNTLRNFLPYRSRAWARSSSASGDGLRPPPTPRILKPREQKMRLNKLETYLLE
jgi:hypothetical protein